MPTLPRILAPLLLAALAVSTGAAYDCTPTTTETPYDTGDVAGTGLGAPAEPAGRYYGTGYICPPGLHCQHAFWIYEESNGIDGLQRADEVVDDTCRGQIAGDTIIF